jgi:hypothetical protein
MVSDFVFFPILYITIWCAVTFTIFYVMPRSFVFDNTIFVSLLLTTAFYFEPQLLRWGGIKLTIASIFIYRYLCIFIFITFLEFFIIGTYRIFFSYPFMTIIIMFFNMAAAVLYALVTHNFNYIYMKDVPWY